MDIADCIKIPTPFAIGRVNCYVFSGEQLTVLDPGPATDGAYTKLAEGLSDLGYGIEDIDRVLISHPHIDHFGQTATIVRESGASVVAHEAASHYISDPTAFLEREQEYFEPFLRSMGLPNQFVDTVVGLPEPYLDFQEPTDIDKTLRQGDVVDVGIKLKIVSTPGHAPASLSFIAEKEGVVFTGDHVLAEISPNPLLTLAPGATDKRTRSLPDYISSLQKLRSVDANTGYGGHREPIRDLHGRIREIDDHHRARKERIAEMLDEQGALTAYDIMQELFPDVPATEMFPGMSEVIGHLDLLEDEGRISIKKTDGVKQYELS